MKSFTPKKIVYSIAEVADMFQVNPSLLRYWENEFDSIRPSRSPKDTRLYREKDIYAIRLVHHLVKEKGLTIAGAKQALKDNKEAIIFTEDIIHRLKSVHSELLALENELKEMENRTSGNDNKP
jgi:DNA-binding transcriptional MerR regulator